MKLALEVITPTKKILTEEVDEITINTANGEISILPNHIDLLTKLVPGEMIIKTGSKVQNFAVTGGFLEISKNKITILADYAVRAVDIEVAKAKEVDLTAATHDAAKRTVEGSVRSMGLKLDYK